MESKNKREAVEEGGQEALKKQKTKESHQTEEEDMDKKNRNNESYDGYTDEDVIDYYSTCVFPLSFTDDEDDELRKTTTSDDDDDGETDIECGDGITTRVSRGWEPIAPDEAVNCIYCGSVMRYNSFCCDHWMGDAQCRNCPHEGQVEIPFDVSKEE